MSKQGETPSFDRNDIIQQKSTKINSLCFLIEMLSKMTSYSPKQIIQILTFISQSHQAFLIFCHINHIDNHMLIQLQDKIPFVGQYGFYNFPIRVTSLFKFSPNIEEALFFKPNYEQTRCYFTDLIPAPITLMDLFHLNHTKFSSVAPELFHSIHSPNISLEYSPPPASKQFFIKLDNPLTLGFKDKKVDGSYRHVTYPFGIPSCEGQIKGQSQFDYINVCNKHWISVPADFEGKYPQSKPQTSDDFNNMEDGLTSIDIQIARNNSVLKLFISQIPDNDSPKHISSLESIRKNPPHLFEKVIPNPHYLKNKNTSQQLPLLTSDSSNTTGDEDISLNSRNSEPTLDKIENHSLINPNEETEDDEHYRMCFLSPIVMNEFRAIFGKKTGPLFMKLFLLHPKALRGTFIGFLRKRAIELRRKKLMITPILTRNVKNNVSSGSVVFRLPEHFKCVIGGKPIKIDYDALDLLIILNKMTLNENSNQYLQGKKNMKTELEIETIQQKEDSHVRVLIKVIKIIRKKKNLNISESTGRLLAITLKLANSLQKLYQKGKIENNGIGIASKTGMTFANPFSHYHFLKRFAHAIFHLDSNSFTNISALFSSKYDFQIMKVLLLYRIFKDEIKNFIKDSNQFEVIGLDFRDNLAIFHVLNYPDINVSLEYQVKN